MCRVLPPTGDLSGVWRFDLVRGDIAFARAPHPEGQFVGNPGLVDLDRKPEGVGHGRSACGKVLLQPCVLGWGGRNGGYSLEFTGGFGQFPSFAESGWGRMVSPPDGEPGQRGQRRHLRDAGLLGLLEYPAQVRFRPGPVAAFEAQRAPFGGHVVQGTTQVAFGGEGDAFTEILISGGVHSVVEGSPNQI